MRTLVLASASAGRAELLRRTGIPFLVHPSRGDEFTGLEDPVQHVCAAALRKAEDVARQRPNSVIIGADTVIELDGEILGKPESDADAERMLRKLAGKHHRLITGLAIIDGDTWERYVGAEITLVHVRHLMPAEIRAYVKSGEPRDKSGAYEIQGLGATIIDRIEGDFSNVVGLPMSHLCGALRQFGIDLLGPI